MFRLTAIFLCMASVAIAQEKPVWLVVARPEFVEALTPLAKKRRQEGMQAVISTRSVKDALADLDRQPAYLLLVGDDQPRHEKQSWYLATRRHHQYHWLRGQQAETFAADALWGDLDGDLAPDIPVGRIPARTKEQVELVVGKILEYEARAPSVEDLRLPIWAGSTQYSEAIDNIAGGILLAAVRHNAPRWSTPWIIYGNAANSLSGWPPDQPSLYTQQMKRGGVITALMGHASPQAFSSMVHERRLVQYSAADARGELAKGPSAAPMVVFACHAGDFTQPTPCLNESFLFMPAGPVATVGATTVSHPLTNYYGGISVLKNLSAGHERLGDLWLTSQSQGMKMRSLIIDRLLSDVEGKREARIDVAKLRRDHLLMYSILGDPATRLKLPQPLEASVEYIDGTWTWKAVKPKGADLLQVGFRPGNVVFPKTTKEIDKDEARELFKRANACFEFKPLTSLKIDADWTGSVKDEGWLRLVTTGSGRIHVTVLKLKRPDEPVE